MVRVHDPAPNYIVVDKLVKSPPFQGGSLRVQVPSTMPNYGVLANRLSGIGTEVTQPIQEVLRSLPDSTKCIGTFLSTPNLGMNQLVLQINCKNIQRVFLQLILR